MKIIVSDSGEQYVVPRKTAVDRRVQRRRDERAWKREMLDA